MTLEYDNINKISQRLSMLFTNREALINLYRTLFGPAFPENLKLWQHGDGGEIGERTIPNYFQDLNNSALSGKGDPNNEVIGRVGQLYIDLDSFDIYVCTVDNSSTNWLMIFTKSSFNRHNYSSHAHEGQWVEYTIETETGTETYWVLENAIARANGRDDIAFNVKNITDDNIYNANQPIYANTAVNLNYTGNVSDISNGSDTIVNAINSINTQIGGDIREVESISKEESFSAINGNTTDGEADLMLVPPYYPEGFEGAIAYPSPGTYFITVGAGTSMAIELVGGGGCHAYTDGGRDNYGDTAWAHHYYHCGGSGAYFKGTAYFPEAGNLLITVPSGKNYQRSIYDTYSYPWDWPDDGEDATATFYTHNGLSVLIAKAGGGKRGYPEFGRGFNAYVDGGTVWYNPAYITHVEVANNGEVGWTYYSVKR